MKTQCWSWPRITNMASYMASSCGSTQLSILEKEIIVKSVKETGEEKGRGTTIILTSTGWQVSLLMECFKEPSSVHLCISPPTDRLI